MNSEIGQDSIPVVALQYRLTEKDTTMCPKDSTLQPVSSPYWIRLVRTADTLWGYDSSSGADWRLNGRCVIALGDTALVGLAVTSRDAGKLNTAKFDNVSITNY